LLGAGADKYEPSVVCVLRSDHVKGEHVDFISFRPSLVVVLFLTNEAEGLYLIGNRSYFILVKRPEINCSHALMVAILHVRGEVALARGEVCVSYLVMVVGHTCVQIIRAAV